MHNTEQFEYHSLLYVLCFLFIQPLLPSPCTPSDAELLLHHVGSSQPDLQLFSSVATTRKFLRSCCDHFKSLITERAQKVCQPIFKGFSYFWLCEKDISHSMSILFLYVHVYKSCESMSFHYSLAHHGTFFCRSAVMYALMHSMCPKNFPDPERISTVTMVERRCALIYTTCATGAADTCTLSFCKFFLHSA